MKIYTSKNCLNCIALKHILTTRNIPYEEIDGTTTKAVAHLRVRKLSMQLPIIENESKFYTYEQFLEMMK